MQSASVNKRVDGWYFHAYSRSNGAWVGTPPFFKLPLEASCDCLGEAINTALDRSLEDVPWPTNWDAVIQPLLDLAAVKSWNVFARTAKHVSLVLDGPVLSLLPCRQHRGSFFFLEDLAFQVTADTSPKGKGEALQRAIALCE